MKESSTISNKDEKYRLNVFPCHRPKNKQTVLLQNAAERQGTRV